MRTPRSLIPPLAVLLSVAAAPAHAQGSGRSLDLDPSVRASGMGAASGAVFWGDDANHWANPALLAYHRGLRYEWGNTRLVPGLAANVTFRREVLKVGGGGFALWTAGQPSRRLGRLTLDYGLSEEIDPSGNPTGTFASFEHIRSWGWAVSAGELAEAIAPFVGRTMPNLSRHGDVSFGMSEKDLEMHLGPGADASTTARDIGVLVRVTPLRATMGPGGLEIPVRADVAYGWSVLSYNDATVTFLLRPDPVSRHHRDAVAFRLAAGWPGGMVQGLADHHLGWLARGLDPLISIGLASDWDHITAGDLQDNDYRTQGSGLEIGLANVFTFRTGSYEDKAGHIDDSTSGWSLGLRFGDWAGFRFDRGRFPQAKDSDLEDVKPKGFSAFVDPVAIWSSLR